MGGFSTYRHDASGGDIRYEYWFSRRVGVFAREPLMGLAGIHGALLAGAQTRSGRRGVGGDRLRRARRIRYSYSACPHHAADRYGGGARAKSYFCLSLIGGGAVCRVVL